MESDPWETLDLDDSDLPSLLRPCKQRRSTSPAAVENSLSPSISSQPPLENHPGQLQQPLPPSSSRRVTVPGPAGAVHAALLRKDLDRKNREFSSHQTGNDGMLSTQDFIRKAMDNTAEFDDDFSHHPWLSALQFIGAEDGLIPSTPISSMKKCLKGHKVVQVVAVVKSCAPNGLGGLLVSLKDPTGTIGASIHHKILSQSEFGKDITAGTVLVLQEVAMFVPVKTAHYLNVTLRNLVKVFCQSKGSTSELYKSAYPVQYSDPARTVKKKMSSIQNVMLEDIETRQCTRTENSQYENVIQKQSLFAGNRDSTSVTAAKRGYINISQPPSNEEPKDTMTTRITSTDQKFVNVTKEGTKGSNSNGSLFKESDNITNPLAETTGEKVQATNEVQIQRQPLTLKATLPEWTDEQLDELFGDEHDCSLF